MFMFYIILIKVFINDKGLKLKLKRELILN
jgi:hypothetical protein